MVPKILLQWSNRNMKEGESLVMVETLFTGVFTVKLFYRSN